MFMFGLIPWSLVVAVAIVVVVVVTHGGEW